MIRVQNHVGMITISEEYFMSLISNTVTNCFGVVRMNVSSAKQTIMASLPFLKNKGAQPGISVRVGKDKLVVDLHITVMYGVNVGAVVKSIMNKVRYTVEESTGISVERVNVFVDGIRV
ncbi:MAG: Asp23/Gls24 family envelope stress response protein [Oscillospiraceae bacterium]|nr:Asp23/Gls24 family envelope stress response protein [Oscillospiraceae bacterium]